MNQQELSDQLLKQVESAKTYNQIIARAWEDESFKQYLSAEPKAVLSEYGIEIPDNLTIIVVENSANLLHVNLPTKPSIEVDKRQLEIRQEYSEQIPQQTDSDRKYYQIVAKAWEDESFKQRFLSEPKAIFKEYGIEVSNNLEIQVVENTVDLAYFIFPAKPSEELNEEELEMVTGGSWKGAFVGGVVGFVLAGPGGAVVGAIAGGVATELE